MSLRREQLRVLVYAKKRGTEAPVAEILARVRGTFAALGALVREIPEETARDRSHGAGWTVQEVVDHVIESDGLASGQLARLLAGEDVEEPIPAGLQSADPSAHDWSRLRQRLAAVHEGLLEQLAGATDDHPLSARVAVELVVKCEEPDGTMVPVTWVERFDWKAFSILIHAHDREHIAQIQRTLGALSGQA